MLNVCFAGVLKIRHLTVCLDKLEPCMTKKRPRRSANIHLPEYYRILRVNLNERAWCPLAQREFPVFSFPPSELIVNGVMHRLIDVLKLLRYCADCFAIQFNWRVLILSNYSIYHQTIFSTYHLKKSITTYFVITKANTSALKYNQPGHRLAKFLSRTNVNEGFSKLRVWNCGVSIT